MSYIASIYARQILDSRGNPTVEAEVLSQRLTSLKVNGVALERPLTLVSRKNHILSRPAAAFRSVLLASISLEGGLKSSEPR